MLSHNNHKFHIKHIKYSSLSHNTCVVTYFMLLKVIHPTANEIRGLKQICQILA